MKAGYIGVLCCLLGVLLITGCSNRHHKKNVRSKAETAKSQVRNQKEDEEKPKHPIILGDHNTTNPIAASVLGH